MDPRRRALPEGDGNKNHQRPLHPLPTDKDLRRDSQRTEDERQRQAIADARVLTSYQPLAYPDPSQHALPLGYGPSYPAANPQHQFPHPTAPHGQFAFGTAPRQLFALHPASNYGQAIPHQPSHPPPNAPQLPHQAPPNGGYGAQAQICEYHHHAQQPAQDAPLGRRRDGQPRIRASRESGKFKGGCSAYARWDDDESCWMNGGQGEEIPPGYKEVMRKFNIEPYDWKTNPEGRNKNVKHRKGPGWIANLATARPRIPSMAKERGRTARCAGTVPTPLVGSAVLPAAADMAETIGGGSVEEAGVAGTGVGGMGARETGGQDPVAPVDDEASVSATQNANGDDDGSLSDVEWEI
ncbi:hypothetical protein MMC30_002357 [Trapelia coarctata]|nr:hypothetical protein [Trapelia coarctata]